MKQGAGEQVEQFQGLKQVLPVTVLRLEEPEAVEKRSLVEVLVLESVKFLVGVEWFLLGTGSLIFPSLL